MSVIRETPTGSIATGSIATGSASTGSGRRPGLLTRLAGRERSRRLSDVAARPPTARGERIMVTAADDSDRAVAATSHALYRQPELDGDWQRWGWETVRRVDWVAARRILAVLPLTAPVAAPTVLRLRQGERLAAFAAERVAASKLLDSWVVLADGRRARVVGRCRPGVPEPLWVVSLADGAPIDSRTDELVTAAIAELRRRHGI